MKQLLSIILGLSLLACSIYSEAATWDIKGHPRMTYIKATSSEFQVPKDVAKVMALGSMAPDYFEFENHNAHSQTRDLPITLDGKLAAIYLFESSQKMAYKNSEKWFNFYFKGAVNAMKNGHRERSAFLLGYALHNVQDFATHQGMPNMVHSAWTELGQSPDQNKERLAFANEMTALVINKYQHAIGAKRWNVFIGKMGESSDPISKTIPEPLSLFGDDLKHWDPTTGFMPSADIDSERAALLINQVLTQVSKRVYRPNTKGEIRDDLFALLLSMGENFLFGLHDRESKMLKLLDIPRSRLDPVVGPVDLKKYLLQALKFKALHEKYLKLTIEEQKILADTTVWRQSVQKNLESMRSKRRAHHQISIDRFDVTGKSNRAFDDHFERKLKKIEKLAAQTPPLVNALNRSPTQPEGKSQLPKDITNKLSDLDETNRQKPREQPRSEMFEERSQSDENNNWTYTEKEDEPNCRWEWVTRYEEQEELVIRKVPKRVGFNENNEAIIEMRDDVVSITRIVPIEEYVKI